MTTILWPSGHKPGLLLSTTNTLLSLLLLLYFQQLLSVLFQAPQLLLAGLKMFKIKLKTYWEVLLAIPGDSQSEISGRLQPGLQIDPKLLLQIFFFHFSVPERKFRFLNSFSEFRIATLLKERLWTFTFSILWQWLHSAYRKCSIHLFICSVGANWSKSSTNGWKSPKLRCKDRYQQISVRALLQVLMEKNNNDWTIMIATSYQEKNLLNVLSAV